MADIPRIGVEEARRKVAAGEALLVCAYPDETKCNKMKLQGSMTLPELESRVPSLPRDQEIIFYCAWPAEATAAGQAERYRSKGFTHAKALKGGVEAWKQAGYPIAAAA